MIVNAREVYCLVVYNDIYNNNGCKKIRIYGELLIYVY